MCGYEGATWCNREGEGVMALLLLPLNHPFFFALSSTIAFSKASIVITSLHIGHLYSSIWFGPDSHFIRHSGWKMCLQLGIFLMLAPLTNSSMQMTQSVVPNSSMSLFFLYLMVGINFLYLPINSSCAFWRRAALSSLVSLGGAGGGWGRRWPDCLEAFSLLISESRSQLTCSDFLHLSLQSREQQEMQRQQQSMRSRMPAICANSC